MRFGTGKRHDLAHAIAHRDDFRVRESLLEDGETEHVIRMRVRDVDRDQIFPGFKNLGSQSMRLAQSKLRIDDDHVFVARDHRRVYVVTVRTVSGVNRNVESRLGKSN